MPEIRIGDIVARKSYGCDMLFRVVDIKNEGDQRQLIIKGISYRIEADSPEYDLEIVSKDKIDSETRISQIMVGKALKRNLNREKATTRDIQTYKKAGKILHLDGASDFASNCREFYKNQGVQAEVIVIPEEEQPNLVARLIQKHSPDILVLTGHDGMIKDNSEFMDPSNYRNSSAFVNAVKEARKIEKSLDELIIFAGACQSNYEEIVEAGANYASAPKRVFIGMLDPAIVAVKIATGTTERTFSAGEVISGVKDGFDAVGGLETRGKLRIGAPMTDNMKRKQIH